MRKHLGIGRRWCVGRLGTLWVLILVGCGGGGPSGEGDGGLPDAGPVQPVWYLDDNVQTTTWLGPNFFGGGGHGDALWDDPGIDRLVLAIPDDTPLVTATPTPPGAVLVRATDGSLILDDPTQGDDFARYCVECGTGPAGQKTIILEYLSADESVFTGYFYVTAFEELQIGIGPAARVYALDSAAGTATELPNATPLVPPDWPTSYCD